MFQIRMEQAKHHMMWQSEKFSSDGAVITITELCAKLAREEEGE